MAMIEKLSEANIAAIDTTRKEWVLRAIRETWEPEKAIAAIPDIYKAGSLVPPKETYTVQSPNEAMKLIAKLSEETEVKWVPPTDTAGWCGWRAFYDYVFNQFGLAKELQPYIQLDKAGVFWWWLFDEVAILCAPPKFSFDRGNPEGEAYRLHCETGPAIVWPDGYGLYFWRGVGIPDDYIDAKNWPKEKLKERYFAEDNQERKRCLSEIVGWELLGEAVGFKKIQSDDWGDLLEVDLGDDDGKLAKFVRVVCPSTGRIYTLRTDPSVTTCLEGCARSGQISVELYKELEES